MQCTACKEKEKCTNIKIDDEVKYLCQECADLLRQPCEIYQRIVGYVRPRSEANDSKRAEIKDRTMFKV
jgi:anaerobic ribonucleoside-triphosphate reductase